MFFNSHVFLLGFLPPALIFYWLIPRREEVRIWYLIAISLIFYGYWDVSFVPLLIGSVLVNWFAARLYAASGWRAIPIAAIALDLLPLGYFKYGSFFVANANAALGTDFVASRLVLPLGISFFTFHNIMYIADLLRGTAPQYRFRDYALYIVLFPQILAGPLVRHRELIPQIPADPWSGDAAERWGRGLTLIVIGLMKKVFIADSLAQFVTPLFAAAHHQAPSLADSWVATLGFTFQIYFDFSGYSDMAIGIALLFGFMLPFNFDAPYRAVSLRDFWRRWHMTLSRFLRDYLYIPLGGNRHGLAAQLGALLATMLLGGLWHGAGWTFVIWGGLHGAGLAAGVLWRRLLPPMPAGLTWALTFAFVAFAWVFFRAANLDQAMLMLRAMAGANGIGAFHHVGPIALAAAVALLGPTSQVFAFERIRPWRWAAATAAFALSLVLLKLGDGQNYDFIYFQF